MNHIDASAPELSAKSRLSLHWFAKSSVCCCGPPTILLLAGAFILKIFNFGSVFKLLTSCGVIKMNCRCSISFATSTNVFMAILRATGSRKTSNSSITRKGVSKDSPMARRRARVVKDRSPPERALTSLDWLLSSLLS